MAVEAATLAVAFLAILGGALARAVYPFLQDQKNKEEELNALRLIPADKLTPEQKQFIENANQPINFFKYYKYTALIGAGTAVVIAMSSLTVATQNIPSGDTFNIALGMLPVWLLAGWGGGGVSNQLIKSGTSSSPTTSIAKAKLASFVSTLTTSSTTKQQQQQEQQQLDDTL